MSIRDGVYGYAETPYYIDSDRKLISFSKTEDANEWLTDFYLVSDIKITPESILQYLTYGGKDIDLNSLVENKSISARIIASKWTREEFLCFKLFTEVNSVRDQNLFICVPITKGC